MNANNLPAAIAKLVMDDIQTEGGSSRSFKDLSKPETGYMVSFKNPTLVLDQPVSLFLSIKNFVVDALASGVANDYTYLGGWRDDKTGLVHIDISVNIPDLDSAIVLAKAMGQIAIFDVVGDRSIYL
jgi:hypothetical protein